MATINIRNARVLDPSTGRDEARDIWISRGAFCREARDAERVIDAAGLIAMPGFVDPHVHLREPGGEEAETVATGCAAAVAGGYSTIVCMPNTAPPLDTPDSVRALAERAKRAGLCRVYAMGCATRGRQGEEPTDIAALAAAGAVGVTDDGAGIASARVALRVMEAAAEAGVLFAEHCEDAELSRGGAIHEGEASRRAGLPGIPSAAEEAMAARDAVLAAHAGARLLVQHVSTAGTVDILRHARKRGVAIHAEATPHHLTLTDTDAASGNPDFKMNPPLRAQSDADALRAALAEGVIDCIATDHAPHTKGAKAKGFLDAPCGVIGLESAFGVLWTELVAPGILSPLRLAEALSLGPARALNLPGGALAPGAPADLTLVDPQRRWTVEPDRFRSKSRNCPFAGRRLVGKVVCTVVGGEIVYQE